MIFSKAVEGYLLFARTRYAKATADHYEQTLQKVTEHFGSRELDSIGVEDLQRYFNFLRNEYKPHRFMKPDQQPTLMTDAGVEGYWKAIRSFYQWAENALQSKRPDKAIPQPKYRLPEVQAFSPDEMRKLLNAAEWTMGVKSKNGNTYRMHRPMYKRNVALIKLMFDTGLRIGEISRLKIKDVDITNGSIVVAPFGTGQKTKPRMVYLGKSALHSMWLYLAEREDNDPTESLFGTNVRSLRSLIRSIGVNAGVDNCHPHRFRHTFAIEFLRKSRDPFTLMRLLGHSNLEMSNHYLEILQSDLKDFHKMGSPVDNNKL